MSMTIIATYEVANVDELHELITALRELEPIKLGCVGTAYAPDEPTFPDKPWSCDRCGSHDFSRATAINDHEVVCGDCADAVDDAPPQGIERPYWAADDGVQGPLVKEADVDLERLLDGTRECTADPCIDPLCETHGVHEWDELAVEPPAVTREAVTSRLYGQLLVACAYHVSRDSWLACVSNWATQARVPGVHGTSPTTLMGDMIALSTFISDSHEFYGVCRELGRDCWGDVFGGAK